MKSKIGLIILITLITIILAISMLIFIYFKIIGLESKIPSNKETSYNIETKKFMDRNVFIATPKNNESNVENKKVILYLHGGAYVGEIESEHWEFIEKIIQDTGATVIIPDYPLSPKYTYKDVFNMIEPLYKKILEKVDTKNLILMGDSAGGGMGLALLEKVTTENEEQNDDILPSKTILISPWLDVRLTNKKIDEVQKNDKELNKEKLKLAGIAYAGNDGINNYLVNPIDGDISKLKNVTIFTGTYDILNPDTEELEKKAKEQNVDIKIKEYETAGHIWIVNKKGDNELIKRAYNDLLEVYNDT